jgi:hypothetical protein
MGRGKVSYCAGLYGCVQTLRVLPAGERNLVPEASVSQWFVGLESHLLQYRLEPWM